MLKTLNKINDSLAKLCRALIVVSIVSLILIMFLQVLRRAFLGSAITWADGTARYLLIWSTFLGATAATWESGQISLTFVQDKLRGKAKMIYECLLMVLFAVLAGFVVYAGTQMLEIVIPQKSDSLPISVAWIFGAIPVCQLIIAFHLVINIANKVTAIMRGETEDGGSAA